MDRKPRLIFMLSAVVAVFYLGLGLIITSPLKEIGELWGITLPLGISLRRPGPVGLRHLYSFRSPGCGAVSFLRVHLV